ncbi:hypothetical protein AB0G60_16240 [Streptomyces angustmyceticus]|uniref:Uncharacterized protein n=1 Tax=Streptomyces angustmyceticus TaxID=285578 RepID=A0A5J4LMV7_9ACTN|nr:hypothetical protein [Streptomyces angustmyceticus]UAL70336.1 hypothetical protein K7396_30340 [Streptomyces angustmyceticus]GES33332.1 hypothetical protein San01_58200 [Streptomyces angustmyceticus]
MRAQDRRQEAGGERPGAAHAACPVAPAAAGTARRTAGAGEARHVVQRTRPVAGTDRGDGAGARVFERSGRSEREAQAHAPRAMSRRTAPVRHTEEPWRTAQPGSSRPVHIPYDVSP